jgi:hypothetical protein
LPTPSVIALVATALAGMASTVVGSMGVRVGAGYRVAAGAVPDVAAAFPATSGGVMSVAGPERLGGGLVVGGPS